MATKKCSNGHLYDPAIYGDKCPFCPSGSTRVNSEFSFEGHGTRVLGEEPHPTETVSVDGMESVGGGTVVRRAKTSENDAEATVGRRLVGLLVSYSDVMEGEVYKVYEGRTTIGRDRTCDIPFPKDKHMSSQHLLIQYVGAKGAFRAQEYDKGSANGTYVNGKVYVLGDVVELKNNDILVIGSTKFIFLAIPEF